MPDYRKTKEALAQLTPEQYRVMQQNGTEAPGSGELLHNHAPCSGSPTTRSALD